MLEKITVRNLAVVESAEAEFVAGLNVITGETGAGKSVLMGALGLLLGGRADSSVVRDGAKEAEVEADFGGMTIRRTITREGKSRVWIDDESVTVTELRERTAALVDIHGPRANQRLLEESFQREALDVFLADALAVRGGFAAAWREWSAAAAELKRLQATGASEDELELLRYQVSEIEGAELSDEDETLPERHAAAAHAEELISDANTVTEALGGDRGAAELLISLQPRFNAMTRNFPAAAEWKARAEELIIGIEELSRSVADAVSRLDAGEESLEELDARLTLVNRLRRKYGPSLADVRSRLEKARARLELLENYGVRLAAAEKAERAARRELDAAGAALTAARVKAADGFAAAVTGELRALGFRQALFSVAVEPAAEPAAHGCDRVVYRFAPNPGEAARDLAAIASSGEIARVMLSLKVVMAETLPDGPKTLVFDEIDANIGGETGAVVGAKLREVAKKVQVVAITHLPQSAVWGERHLRVVKSVEGGRTSTKIAVIEGEDRVAEIARMLGGENITRVVKEHATELLELSH